MHRLFQAQKSSEGVVRYVFIFILLLMGGCLPESKISLKKLEVVREGGDQEVLLSGDDSKRVLKATSHWGAKTEAFAGVDLNQIHLDGNWSFEGKISLQTDLAGQQAGVYLGVKERHYRLIVGRLATHQGVPFNVGLWSSEGEKISIALPHYQSGELVELRISKIGGSIWGFYRFRDQPWIAVGFLPYRQEVLSIKKGGFCFIDENPYKNETRIADPTMIQNGVAECTLLTVSSKVDPSIVDHLPRVYIRAKIMGVQGGALPVKIAYTLYRQMQERLAQGGFSGNGERQVTKPIWGAMIPWDEIQSSFAIGATTPWQDFTPIFSTPLSTSVLSLSFYQPSQGAPAGIDLGNVQGLKVQIDFADLPAEESIRKSIVFDQNASTVAMQITENNGALQGWAQGIRLLDDYARSIVDVYSHQGVKVLPKADWFKISGSFHEGYFGSLYSEKGKESIATIEKMIGIYAPSTMILPIFSGATPESEAYNIWDEGYVAKAKQAILTHPSYESSGSKLPNDRPVYIKFGDEFHLMPIQTLRHFPRAQMKFRDFLKEKGVSLERVQKKSWDEVFPLEKGSIKTAGDAAIYYWTVWFQQIQSNRMYALHRQMIHEIWGDQAYGGGSNYLAGFNVTPDYFVEAREKGMDVQAHHYGSGDTVSSRQVNADLFVADLLRSAANEGTICKGVLSFASRIGNGIGTRLSHLAALNREMRCFYYYGMGPQVTGWEWFVDDREKVDAFVGVHEAMAMATKYESYLKSGRNGKAKVGIVMSRSAVIWADLADDQLVQIFGYDEAKAKRTERDAASQHTPAAGWFTERRLIHTALNNRNYRTDIVPEENLEQGKIKEYQVLYVTEPNLSQKAQEVLRYWVKAGGVLYLGVEAATRDEYNQSNAFLPLVAPQGSSVEMIKKDESAAFAKRGGYGEVWEVKSSYDQEEIKGLHILDEIQGKQGKYSALVRREKIMIPSATTIGSFTNGDPAYLSFSVGKGKVYKAATCLGTMYGRSASPSFDAVTDLPIPRDSMVSSGVSAFYQREYAEEIEEWLVQPAMEAAVPRNAVAVKSGFDLGLFENKKGAVVLIGKWNKLKESEYTFEIELKKHYSEVKSWQGEKPRVIWKGNRAQVTIPVEVIQAIEFSDSPIESK